MTKPRLRLKALGLCVLVLGLMTFGLAGVAQADSWNVFNSEGKLIEIPGAGDLLPELKVEIEAGTALILEFKTPGGTLVEFRCTAVELIGVGGGLPRLGPKGSLSEGKFKYTGCSTFLNGKVSGACEAKSKGQPVGTIETEKFNGLMALGTGSVPLVLILPLVKNAKGEPLFAIIETGELCSIGAKVEVTGHLDLADCLSKFQDALVTHLLVEPASFRLLKALGQLAQLLGSTNAALAGAHVGIKWGGVFP